MNEPHEQALVPNASYCSQKLVVRAWNTIEIKPINFPENLLMDSSNITCLNLSVKPIRPIKSFNRLELNRQRVIQRQLRPKGQNRRKIPRKTRRSRVFMQPTQDSHKNIGALLSCVHCTMSAAHTGGRTRGVPQAIS